MPVGAGLAVAGVGAIVGGVVSSKASNNATKAQMHSSDQALAYQKEQDAYARSVEERKWQDYQQRHAAWEARRPGGPVAGASGPTNMSPVAVAARNAVSGGAPSWQGASLGDLMRPGGASAAADMYGDAPPDVSAAPAGVQEAGAMPSQQGMTLADLARWSDHRNYLGG